MRKKLNEILTADEFCNKQDDLSQAKDLESLFDVWKDAHLEEKAPEETLPFSSKEHILGRNFQGNFFRDGVTTLAGHEPQSVPPKVDILFVLKESNASEESHTEESNANGDSHSCAPFWFNELDESDQSLEKASSISARKRYKKNLEMALCRLGQDSCHTRFGYMNLNKRGGFGSTHYVQLKAYTAKYRRFILRQIELHDPQTIVFCGCYNGIASLLFKNVRSTWDCQPKTAQINGHPVKLFYLYHPACPSFKKSLPNLSL